MNLFTAAASYLAPLLTDEATIQRKTLTDDGALGHTTTWEDIATVACLLDRTATRGMENVQSGVLKSVEQWQCAFPLGTDIQPADRVVISEERFEVSESNFPQTTAAVLSVDLVRVR